MQAEDAGHYMCTSTIQNSTTSRVCRVDVGGTMTSGEEGGEQLKHAFLKHDLIIFHSLSSVGRVHISSFIPRLHHSDPIENRVWILSLGELGPVNIQEVGVN